MHRSPDSSPWTTPTSLDYTSILPRNEQVWGHCFLEKPRCFIHRAWSCILISKIIAHETFMRNMGFRPSSSGLVPRQSQRRTWNTIGEGSLAPNNSLQRSSGRQNVHIA